MSRIRIEGVKRLIGLDWDQRGLQVRAVTFGCEVCDLWL